MIRLEFSPEIIEQLLYEKRYHPHPRVRQKMEALYYKSLGMPHHQICQLSNIQGRATLVRYFREYQEGGLDRLRKLNFRKPESWLTDKSRAVGRKVGQIGRPDQRTNPRCPNPPRSTIR
jgi:hypothetical protein